MENAYSAGVHGGGCFKGVDSPASRFAAYQPNAFVLDKIVKAADRIRAAANAGDNGVGQSAFLFKQLLLDFP